MLSITRGSHGALGSLSKLADGIRANTGMNRAASLSRGPNLGSKMNAAPWSNTWPAPGATLDLDFANDRGFIRGIGQGKSLGGVTFTRASNAQYIDSTGTLQTAANSVVRYDWASTTQTGSGTPASPYIIPLQSSATCNGLLIEESRTNRALWCRDATQSSWVNTNVTAALDQTGIDEVANSASSLTASAANGTTIQTVTLASGARTSSIYLKRLTGTGAVQVTMDGTTWTTIDLSNGLWNRIAVSSTVTNPVIGVQIVTSGDAVAMDFAQIEDGAFATSPILTTSATVTRAADNASLLGVNFAGWYNYGRGTVFAEGLVTAVSGSFFNICDAGSVGTVERMQLRSNTTNYQFIYGAGGSPSSITFGSYSNTSTSKAAVTYNRGEITGCVNSSTVSGLNTSKNTMPAEMRIGRAGTAEYANGTIKRIVYFPTKLNEFTLKVLTGQSA